MGKYIVIKDLVNIRNYPAIKDETFIGTLSLGEEIDLIDDPVAGEKPDGTDDTMWHGDSLNRYIARAAVATADSYAAKKAAFIADTFNKDFLDLSEPGNEDKWKVSWGHVDLEIWRIWKSYGISGKGVKVAVLDTGVVTKSNDLNSPNKIDWAKSLNLNTWNNNVDDTDIEHDGFHGTKSAGLIGANGKASNTVFGVAPDVQLIIFKVMDDSHGTNFTPYNFSLAIKKALEANVDIISISLELDELDESLKDNLDLCRSKDVFVIASSGDGKGFNSKIPASLPNVFSIGAYRLDNNKEEYFQEMSYYNNNMAFLCPGNHILTTGSLSSPVYHENTSASAAFATGIVALALEYARMNGKPFTPNLLKGILKECCVQSSGSISFSEEEGYGILIPQNLINHLKKIT